MPGLIWPEVQHGLVPQTAEQQSIINCVSQLGNLMLLLLTGWRPTDLRLVRRVGNAAITVAAAGLAIPFVCDFALGEMLPDSILPDPQANRAVSCHRALDLLHQNRRDGGARNELHTPGHRSDHCRVRHPGGFSVGGLLSPSASVWRLRHRRSAIVSFAVLGTLLFLSVSFTIGRRVVFGLIRWTNDHFISEFAILP
jgi:Kef-type K+ transport system membrane component KefB